MSYNSLVFKICEEDKKFVVRDQAGVRYGVYQTRAEAQEALDGWSAYYAGGEEKL